MGFSHREDCSSIQKKGQPLSSPSVKKNRQGQVGCCERVGPRFFGGEECGDKDLTPGFVW